LDHYPIREWDKLFQPLSLFSSDSDKQVRSDKQIRTYALEPHCKGLALPNPYERTTLLTLNCITPDKFESKQYCFYLLVTKIDFR
jgi:hypothetical protein